MLGAAASGCSERVGLGHRVGLLSRCEGGFGSKRSLDVVVMV